LDSGVHWWWWWLSVAGSLYSVISKKSISIFYRHA
jgi:hypothetical protein